MSEQYLEMWKKLGLDIKAHNALLGVLGDVYQKAFLSQEGRPKGMEYFDFVMSEVHGLRVKELMDAKAAGRKVIGSFCVFVPEELILAANAVSIGLCTGAEFGFDLAEKVLPTTTCALIKSLFGFKLGKVCPYMEASDMIVGENTCDGKKKAYESFGKIVDNIYVMDMPQTKSDSAKTLLRSEYLKFKIALESLTGNKITVEKLKSAIQTVNEKRSAIMRLNALRENDPAPISGLDSLLINQLSFFDDPARFTGSVNALCDELEACAKKKRGVFPKGHTRLLISGCPMAIPNWKMPMIAETSGAVIVGEESCVGERSSRWLTEDSGSSLEELFENVVKRYFNIDCAIFTPNPSRLDHLKEMAKQYKADGVILYSLNFCQPYQMESRLYESEFLKTDLPALRVDTDYSQEDTGQIKTRIEAFIEMINSR